MDEIVYVKVVDRNIVVMTESGLQEGSLTNQLEFILSKCGFMRVNQSKIVNLKKLKSYDEELSLIYFEDITETCQVSRRNKQKVLDHFDKM